MKQTFLSGATLAALVMLVALPLVFILLQAIFPHFSAGSLGDAFGGIPALLADPQLPAMLGGTLWIAAGVALVSVILACRSASCAVCFRCRCPGCGISCF